MVADVQGLEGLGSLGLRQCARPDAALEEGVEILEGQHASPPGGAGRSARAKNKPDRTRITSIANFLGLANPMAHRPVEFVVRTTFAFPHRRDKPGGAEPERWGSLAKAVGAKAD